MLLCKQDKTRGLSEDNKGNFMGVSEQRFITMGELLLRLSPPNTIGRHVMR